jgi:ArsR family transcriptional regulator
MRNKIELFKVLSEPNRVRILMMLLQKPMCVCEITSVLGISTATVSNHLSYLRKEGFIEDEKDGKWINYRIAQNIENPIVKSIIESLPNWFENENEIQNDLMKVKSADRYEISCSDKAKK